MIKRNVNLRINNDKAILSEKIIVYTDDNGIEVNIKPQNLPYLYNNRQKDILDGDVTVTATLKKPDETKINMDLEVVGGIIKMVIDSSLTDEISEIGEYKVQMHLYDDSTKANQTTLPPFSFFVKASLGDVVA